MRVTAICASILSCSPLPSSRQHAPATLDVRLRAGAARDRDLTEWPQHRRRLAVHRPNRGSCDVDPGDGSRQSLRAAGERRDVSWKLVFSSDATPRSYAVTATASGFPAATFTIVAQKAYVSRSLNEGRTRGPRGRAWPELTHARLWNARFHLPGLHVDALEEDGLAAPTCQLLIRAAALASLEHEVAADSQDDGDDERDQHHRRQKHVDVHYSSLKESECEFRCRPKCGRRVRACPNPS
jgi:hypothetical protein